MRNVSDAWRNYIQNTTEKTLVKCLRVETKDHIAYGATNHTRDILFDGTVYYTSQGLTDTALARTEGFAVDNMEFTMLLTPAMHVAIEAGKFDGAKCYVFLLDFTDLSKKEIPLSTGYIGEITRDGGAVKAEILGLMSRLGRKTGRVYSIECDAILGDSRCKVPMLDFPVTGEMTIVAADKSIAWSSGYFDLLGFGPGKVIRLTGSTAGNNGVYLLASGPGGNILITSQAIAADEVGTMTVTLVNNHTFTKTVATVEDIAPRRMFAMSDNLDSYGGTMENHWLFGGQVTFLTGANSGESRDISSHIGVDLEFYLEFPFDIQVGDTYTVSVGCDFLRDTCRDKFNNIVNHRGFPQCPTNYDLFNLPVVSGA